jgi:hypothetical protein
VAVDCLHRYFQRFSQLGSGPSLLGLWQQAVSEESPTYDCALPLG